MVISPAGASCLTRSMRTFCRDGLGVSCGKEEKRSTEGRGFEGSSPHVVEMWGWSLSSMMSSLREGRQRIFL